MNGILLENKFNIKFVEGEKIHFYETSISIRINNQDTN